ncbi:MAG: hypothetical protein ACRC4M_03230 [Mycoplasma sp.]
MKKLLSIGMKLKDTSTENEIDEIINEEVIGEEWSHGDYTWYKQIPQILSKEDLDIDIEKSLEILNRILKFEPDVMENYYYPEDFEYNMVYSILIEHDLIKDNIEVDSFISDNHKLIFNYQTNSYRIDFKSMEDLNYFEGKINSLIEKNEESLENSNTLKINENIKNVLKQDEYAVIGVCEEGEELLLNYDGEFYWIVSLIKGGEDFNVLARVYDKDVAETFLKNSDIAKQDKCRVYIKESKEIFILANKQISLKSILSLPKTKTRNKQNTFSS